MSLTNQDRELLRRCLEHKPGAWNDFVDRFLGLIYHVIRHTAHLRSVPLGPEDTEDLAAEVLLQVVANDYAVLRQFRGSASLATYLTVIARRLCVHELARRSAARGIQPAEEAPPLRVAKPPSGSGFDDIEQVENLLGRLPKKERKVVRLHYLEGRSYEEISSALNIPVNSIGPILSRARKRLRNGKSEPRREKRPPEPPKEGGEKKAEEEGSGEHREAPTS